MDSWFNQLFDIIEKQSDPNKVELLIHELYNEFDILVRRNDTDSLKEIYYYVEDTDPIKTVDKSYNIQNNEKMRRELLKKLVMLDDLSILENQLIVLIKDSTDKEIKNFIKSWESFTFVYYHLQDFYNYQLELLERGEFGSNSSSLIEDELLDEEIFAEEEILSDDEEFIEEVPEVEDVSKVEEEIIEEKIEEKIEEPIKPIIKKVEEKVVEPKVETKPKTKDINKPVKQEESPKEVIKELSVIETKNQETVVLKPVIEEKPISKSEKEVIKKEPEKIIVSNVLPADTEIVYESDDVEVDENTKVVTKIVYVEKEVEKKVESTSSRKSVDSTEYIKPKLEFKEAILPKAPRHEHLTNLDDFDNHNRFFDLVDLLVDKYGMVVNKDVLRRLNNPRPNFYRVVLEYVEEKDRNAAFFNQLFDIFYEYDLVDCISYITGKSNQLKRLLSFTIGLLNIEDLEAKLQLLNRIPNEDEAYIKDSIQERDIRLLIDGLDISNRNIVDLYKNCLETTKIAPKMLDVYHVSSSIEYLQQNVFDKQIGVIDKNNVTELYWSILLATTSCVYVHRKNVNDFTHSMEWIGFAGLELMKNTSDYKVVKIIKNLCKNYIREVFKQGQLSENYHTWWARQQDDLLNAKLNSIQMLNDYQ